MTKSELLQRIGEAAIRNRRAQQALQHSDSHGNYQQARLDRAAAADAQRALDAAMDAAEQMGAV